MYIEIEIISGKILDLLDQERKLNFNELNKRIHEPRELVAQGLQWLILTGFITENAITREYAINALQKATKEELMVA